MWVPHHRDLCAASWNAHYIARLVRHFQRLTGSLPKRGRLRSSLPDAAAENGLGSDSSVVLDVPSSYHDMVRMMVLNYRAGCYDDAIRACGRDPDEYR